MMEAKILCGKPKNFLSFQINNPSELLSMYPGTLLKLQIECPVGFRRFRKNEICLLLKIEGKTNVSFQFGFRLRYRYFICCLVSFVSAVPRP